MKTYKVYLKLPGKTVKKYDGRGSIGDSVKINPYELTIKADKWLHDDTVVIFYIGKKSIDTREIAMFSINNIYGIEEVNDGES
jgi:hypothetical protein